MDTGALRYDGESNGIETGERYTVVFWIESESGLTLEDPSIGTEFRARDRTATFETGQNDTVRLAAVPDARLSGTTTLAPGTELEVEARASGTFLRRNETRVDEDGTFTTTLNLSAVEPRTTFTAIVDGLDVAATGIVTNGTEPPAAPDRVPTTERPGDDGTPEATATLGDERNALPAAEPSPTETEPTPTTRSGTTTDASGAGFGAVAALVAILTLAGLRLRRRRTA
jgi:PGF-CTERM protein